MRKRIVLTLLIVGSIAAPAALAGLTLLGIRRALEDSRVASTHAAVEAISRGVAAEVRAGRSPSPTEIEDNIRKLVDAGAIAASFDRNGRSTDVYGTPFRVTIHGRLVTASSAGPDRSFGTADDIDFTAEP